MITALSRTACRTSNICRVATIVAAGFALSACAQIGGPSGPDFGLGGGEPAALANAGPDEMGKALRYWGGQYAKNPDDKQIALNFAKNLKAAGQKAQAFAVLQQASVMHGKDRDIASEYGRLALESNKIQLAVKLLQIADDPTNPDWRIVLGRGAALAKLGQYGEAVAMFERAQNLAPSNPSVLNNLAMAHAGNGNLKQAETLLREAGQNPMAREKVAKNLALVLDLQGRKAAAQQIATGGTDAIRRSINPTAEPQAVRSVAQAMPR